MNDWNQPPNPGLNAGPPGGMGSARSKVQAPATIMMVVAGLGILLALFGLALNMFGMGMGMLNAEQMGDQQVMANMFSGSFGIVQAIVGIIVSSGVIYGALQMKNLSNYGLALAAAILICVPFCSPCCILGLPVGIWAVVVLMDDDVKAAFR